MDGRNSNILEVDLTTKQAVVVDLDAEVARNFLGGLGLCIKILYDEVGPSIDALSPENIIVIAPGPLNGTSFPTNGRTVIMTKSPLTGILGMGSFGGFWGPRLKRTGFEAIVIRGSSDKPVYLWIEDNIAEVRSAEHIWGKDTWETTDVLKEELGKDISVLSIGQAGENLVRFACPVIDYYHAPGRSHTGCVMGAKKLKAIAVRGTKEVAVADLSKLKEVVRETTGRLLTSANGKRRERAKVIGVGVRDMIETGLITGENFQTGIIPLDNELFLIPKSVQSYLKRAKFGYFCPLEKYVGCDFVADVDTGPCAGVRVGGVYCCNSWWGPQCGIKSFTSVWKCRELCQRYGLDQVGPVPFAMELFQRSIITKEDLGGLELNWGNDSAVIEILRKIAFREGIGNILAEGSVRAAKKIGKAAEKYALTVKGMELYRDDPRAGTMVHVLGVATCPRGGDEQYSVMFCPESCSDGFSEQAKEVGWSEAQYLRWWVNYLDMFDDVKREIYGEPPSIDALRAGSLRRTAVVAKWYQELNGVINSLGLCLRSGSASGAMGPTHYAKLYSACTGWQMTPREIMRAGERTFNLMRGYLVREGITRKDDNYPDRFYEEPIPDGPKRGAILYRDKVSRVLEEYYDTVGWNKKTGVPTKEKLIALNLGYVADELC